MWTCDKLIGVCINKDSDSYAKSYTYSNVYDYNKYWSSNMLSRSCNHKRISLYYQINAISNGISGIIISYLIKLELDIESIKI
jgi:hypothetical protein